MNENKTTREYYQKISQQATDIIQKNIPEKLKELDQMVEDGKWSIKQLDQSDQNLIVDIQKLKVTPYQTDKSSHDQIPCNKMILELVKEIKPFLVELQDEILILRNWIQLNIPRIEDGNNFGVEIQEEISKKLFNVQDKIEERLVGLYFYHRKRAKAVTKLLKHPSVEDYREEIHGIDFEYFQWLRTTLLWLRQRYATIFNLIELNREKLTNPRTSNHSPLY